MNEKKYLALIITFILIVSGLAFSLLFLWPKGEGKNSQISVEKNEDLASIKNSKSRPSNYEYILWNQENYSEKCHGIAIDSLGNIYLAGDFTYDFIGAGGPYDEKDICLVKYNKSKVEQWNRTITIGQRDECWDITIDSQDNIYLVGWSSFEASADIDILLLKYNSSGELLFNITWGGPNNDYGYALALDSLNNIWVAGEVYTSTSDGLLVKFDENGNYLWNTTWGGGHNDEFRDVTLDTMNNIYVTGTTFGSLATGGYNVCVLKYNSLGILQWQKIWGKQYTGPESDYHYYDYGYAISLDSSENVIVSGYSDLFQLVGPVHVHKGYGSFIVKYNKTSIYQWETYWGEHGDGISYDMKLDSLNNIFIVGYCTNNSQDFLFAKFNATGEYQWSSTWGGASVDRAYALTFDALNNALIAGETYSFDAINFDMCLIIEDPPPQIKINSPKLNQIFRTTPPEFNINVSDSNIDMMWYTLDNGITNTIFTSNDTISQPIWDTFGSGNVTIEFYANDTSGSIAYANVIVIKDIEFQYLKILSPVENEIYGILTPSFIVEIYDQNIDTMWYTLDNGVTNTIFTSNTTISQTLWDAFGSGNITIDFYANDTLGHVGSANVTVRKDVDHPGVDIINPINNELYGVIAPSFTIKVSDQNVDTMWYTLNNGITNITFTSNDTISQSLWDIFGSGNITIEFYANDTLGHVGHASITVRKDVEYPSVSIINPINNELYGVIAPLFTIEVTDQNVEAMWYTLDNGITNTTFTSNNTISQTLWNTFGSGNITIEFYANDTLGHVGHARVIVVKDITPPIIAINNPIQNQIFGIIPPTYNISITELYLDTMWYTINGEITKFMITTTAGSIDSIVWDEFSDKTITIRFYANDTAGNEIFSQVSIIKNTHEPEQGIPGFNLLILINLSIIIIGLLYKRKYKAAN